MSEAFAHLHVASGFSLRYGASTPATLVERAAAHGQPALALTDRDGLYGAVRFVQACDEAGIAPVLGVDLAVSAARLLGRPRLTALPAFPARRGCLRSQGAPAPRARPQGRANPVRGGVEVDPRHPRVTVLARGQGGGAAPGAGWGRLCRLVTSTHLCGERGAPVSSPALLAEHATDPATGDLRPRRPARPRLRRGPGPARAAARPGAGAAARLDGRAAARQPRHRGGLPRRPGGHPGQPRARRAAAGPGRARPGCLRC